uniref:Uncharacterized protein n=1 Tax=Neogobius melanostomus TaxID=47308 RepID=A0A8C6TE59_9GOBI
MRPRSIALIRHSRAAFMDPCRFGLSAAFPTTVRISSSSLSISFLASSALSEFSMLLIITMPRCWMSVFGWRQRRCRISSHWVVCERKRDSQQVLHFALRSL